MITSLPSNGGRDSASAIEIPPRMAAQVRNGIVALMRAPRSGSRMAHGTLRAPGGTGIPQVIAHGSCR
jgi:hypothetical protein